jgi:hypothetical protein
MCLLSTVPRHRGRSIALVPSKRIFVRGPHASWNQLGSAPGLIVAIMAFVGERSATGSRGPIDARPLVERRVVTALATVVPAVPGAILLVSYSGLRRAQVCLRQPDQVGATEHISGALLADTEDRIVLACVRRKAWRFQRWRSTGSSSAIRYLATHATGRRRAVS